MILKHLLIRSVEFYQRKISPLLGQNCVFFPTCSEYTREAVEKYGTVRGTWIGMRRILRCHPWQKNNIDPLP